MLFKGQGGRRDIRGAVEMSVRACVLGVKKSCAWPKRKLVEYKRCLKPDDVARLGAELDAACQSGNAEACSGPPPPAP